MGPAVSAAGRAITVDVDRFTSDPAGATATLAGSLTAAATVVTGGDDNDTFAIRPQAGTPITVLGQTPVFGDPGVASAVQKDVKGIGLNNIGAST